MIKNNEMIKGIGLVLMFLLGWVASDLFNSIKCGDCNYRQEGLERRVQAMKPYKNRYDMMRENPNKGETIQQRQRRQKGEYRKIRPEDNTNG